MSRLHERFAELLPDNEPVLAGVSGGVDSMVLMHLLAQRGSVQVAHLNHQLRGRSSEADEGLVRKTAEKWGMCCHVERAKVREVARKSGISIEMAARQCRHKFFARLARKLGIRKLALAHHADDQVELFFLRLLRGAGPEGLAGMAEVAPSFADPQLTIVRPLLGVTKEELRAYAAEHDIPFAEDATNASASILRNRIRNKLIPLLQKQYQPALTHTILRVMDLIRAESHFVARAGECAREPFHKLPVALQRRRLRQQLYVAGIEASFDWVEHLRQHPGKPITFAPGRIVTADSSGAVSVSDLSNRSGDGSSALVRCPVQSPGAAQFGSLTASWSIISKPGKREVNCEYFDADSIGESATLRHWQPGDRFQPIGMPAAVKLQDIFTNLKVPRARRHQLAVATTGTGEIFWVEGLRIGERFKLTPGTTRCLRWSWRRHETC